jgi:hypothetical protein
VIEVDPISTNIKLGVVVCTCHPSYMGSINRRIAVKASLGIKGRPDQKITKLKKARSMTQVIEDLSIKKKKTIIKKSKVKEWSAPHLKSKDEEYFLTQIALHKAFLTPLVKFGHIYSRVLFIFVFLIFLKII